MKPSFIWDMDGTLIDSYQNIVASLVQLAAQVHFPMERDAIEAFCKKTSVHNFLSLISRELSMDFSLVKDRYSQISRVEKTPIRAMPFARETLETLAAQGSRHFLYTHKGPSALTVLDRLGLRSCFGEIITGDMGFRRKPDPEAIDYLINKHGLRRKETYYVGDRDLDVDCARNARIGSVLLASEYTSRVADYQIVQLNELSKILWPIA